jgi:glycosyltransferase involved in cell wall biosynthesis
MRITWVLPFLQFTGGIRVLYEHTRQLRARGHEVTLVAPQSGPALPVTPAGARALRVWLAEKLVLRSERMLEFYGLRDALRIVPALEGRHLPPADVTLATSFHTAPAVAEAPDSVGRRAYFLQHYEAFDPANAERVDASWQLPFERIVIASWMVRFAAERFGVRVWGPIVNGVDLEQFHDRGRRENDPPVVGMLYETMPWKGCDDGFAAIALARAQVPGLGLHLFGRPRLARALGPLDRFERNPSPARLSAIYRECDLFLSPSWTEGCQLPPMEAMASGCAVVATEVGGVPDYAVPGTTALTAPPHRPEMLAAHLVGLATDVALRREVARRGHEHIARFTWSHATDLLEATLEAILRGERP